MNYQFFDLKAQGAYNVCMYRTPTPEQAKELTLNWVNKIRTHEGTHLLEELPKGVRGCPTRCVIAEALGKRYAVASDWIKKDGKDVYRTPTHCGEFISYFDQGTYPELVKTQEDIRFEREVGELIAKTQTLGEQKQEEAQV